MRKVAAAEAEEAPPSLWLSFKGLLLFPTLGETKPA